MKRRRSNASFMREHNKEVAHVRWQLDEFRRELARDVRAEHISQRQSDNLLVKMAKQVSEAMTS